MMQDWAGWLLMLFSFSIVLMWKHVRSDRKVVHAIWFCLVVHHAVVFLNVYIPDAYTFHWNGARLAALPVLEWLSDFGNFNSSVESGGPVIATTGNYIRFLGFFYYVFGASRFFGAELSVLAFTLSCVVLVKLVDFLDLRRFRVWIVLFFGLLPSAVIFRSVTLREPWQVLFFLLSVYWAIRLWKRPSILIVSFLLVSVFCLALLHHALAGYATYLIVVSVYWGVVSSRKKSIRWARHVRLLFAVLLVACVIVLAQKMGWFISVGHALEGVEGFRYASAIHQGRTVYGVMLDTSSVLGLVKTTLMVFVQYMFAPFPWQTENVKDVYALLESMLRIVLLVFAVSSWRRSSGEVRSCYSFLLIIYLGMELMWALGTISWGTAIRHHVPGYSVIVLLGVPGLILFMRRLHFGMFGRRKVNTMLPE